MTVVSAGMELGVYVDRLPFDRPLSEDEVVRCLLGYKIPQKNVPKAISALVDLGHMVRLEDGSLQRRKVDASLVETRPADHSSRGTSDNPEYASFRAGVLNIVDERLRELGLIA